MCIFLNHKGYVKVYLFWYLHIKTEMLFTNVYQKQSRNSIYHKLLDYSKTKKRNDS